MRHAGKKNPGDKVQKMKGGVKKGGKEERGGGKMKQRTRELAERKPGKEETGHCGKVRIRVGEETDFVGRSGDCENAEEERWRPEEKNSRTKKTRDEEHRKQGEKLKK